MFEQGWMARQASSVRKELRDRPSWIGSIEDIGRKVQASKKSKITKHPLKLESYE